MKILILGNLRSGSTALFNAFYKSMDDYRGYSEPFNPVEEGFGDLKSTYSLEYPNLIVKLLPWDLHHHFSFVIIDQFFQNNTYSLDQIKNLIVQSLYSYVSNFDKVILLARKNKLEQAQSYSFAASNKNSYHIPYKYNNDFQDLSQSFNLIKNHDDILTHLSNRWKIPLTYYEDLFQGNITNIKNFLETNQIKVDNFELFCDILNPKNRYRQN